MINSNPQLVEALRLVRETIGDLRNGFSRSVDPARWVEQVQAHIDEALSSPLPVTEDDVERAVKVCPQCEGEGGYPDGLDEAACHTECTRCGSNGWIVDVAAISALTSKGDRS